MYISVHERLLKFTNEQFGMGTKVLLSEEEIPKKWYNILPELPAPLPPPIDPRTKEPVKPQDLELLFCKEVIRQELSQDLFIDIPADVIDAYRLWRPTPLYRAHRLERFLKTPAKIYYKYEGVSPPGSHKPNTAVPQAYYNMKEGIKRLTTETGAGQWGSALAFGANMFGLKAVIYMVRSSYEQKPFRKSMMHVWNADVYPSPSDKTEFGKRVLKEDPDNLGSLGIAISEAIEDAVTHEDTKYTIGSVLNHVLLHQTVIGQEAILQLKVLDDYPDLVVGCVGGGSSFSGLFWPFYHEKKSKKAPKQPRFLAVEPTACPTMTKGEYIFDHGETARLTPLLKMYTLGHTFMPPPIHAGGLRYHGDAPTLCLLLAKGEVEARAYDQVSVFEAATIFASTEGIIPAPEPSHAIRAVIDEALACKEKGEEKTILFLLCGHGHFDMKAFDDYFEDKLQRYEYPKEEVERALKQLRDMYPWLDKLAY